MYIKPRIFWAPTFGSREVRAQYRGLNNYLHYFGEFLINIIVMGPNTLF